MEHYWHVHIGGNMKQSIDANGVLTTVGDIYFHGNYEDGLEQAKTRANIFIEVNTPEKMPRFYLCDKNDLSRVTRFDAT